MASQPESEVVSLVHKLIESKKTFSISIEDPESPAVKIILEQGHNLGFLRPDFARFTTCVYEPGKGWTCVP